MVIVVLYFWSVQLCITQATKQLKYPNCTVIPFKYCIQQNLSVYGFSFKHKLFPTHYWPVDEWYVSSAKVFPRITTFHSNNIMKVSPTKVLPYALSRGESGDTLPSPF